MPTNTNLLRGKIIEKGYTQASIAKAIGITYQSFSKKINNLVPFKVSEIVRLCELLDIRDKDAYFFCC